jgi:3',5'-cyclic-AMP phosphodiesterase
MKAYQRILHITDSHLFGDKKIEFLGINTCTILSAVVDHIKQTGFDQGAKLTAFTGDISQDYSLASYTNAFSAMVELAVPFLVVPGNHDDKDAMLQELGESGCSSAIARQMTLDHNWHVVMLDSHWLGQVKGLLEEKELAFLRVELEQHRDKNIMIFIHHHVLPVGSAWLDKINLFNAQQFLDVVAGHDNVKAVFCGHAHQEFAGKYKHIDFYTTPSTSLQFAPQKIKFALDTTMPGYRIIDLFADGTYETKVVRLAYSEQFLPDLSSKGY